MPKSQLNFGVGVTTKFIIMDKLKKLIVRKPVIVMKNNDMQKIKGGETVPAIGVGTIPAIGVGTIPAIGVGTIPAIGVGTIPAIGVGPIDEGGE